MTIFSCVIINFPAEILQANDSLTQVINTYRQLVKGEEINGESASGSMPGEPRHLDL